MVFGMQERRRAGARWFLRGAAWLGLIVAACGAPGEGRALPVRVEFFYSEGCAECDEIEGMVLPEIRDQFGGSIEVLERDVGIASNYTRLAELQARLGVRTDDPVSMVVNGRTYLGGVRAIRSRLADAVEAELAATARGAEGKDLGVSGGRPAPVAESVLGQRLRVVGVLGAGLADGVNPCAFATVIFFVTLVTASGRRGRDLLRVGASFCVAVFVTYFLLGLGVFHALRALAGWNAAGRVLDAAMAAALLVLAILSFRDAWRYGRTGESRAVLLQLPDGMKQRIHGLVRSRLSGGGLVLGSVVAGVGVTLLESVCTGQMYLPTLVILARDFGEGRAWGLLALYNVLFVVPLLVVLAAAWAGTRNERLVEWSRRHVVGSKVLMGILFLVLSGILLRGLVGRIGLFP